MARRPIFSENQLNEILKNSPYLMNNKQSISEKYKVSDKTAERIMKKLKLIQTSPSNIECITRYINGERSGDLVKEYGMSQVNFNALLRFRGIEPRYTQYFFNHNYFEEIDSEDKAYFLGFIYADGNIFNNSLKISIRDTDIDVLQKLKICTNSNHKIRNFINGGYSTTDSSCKMVELILTHQKLPLILKNHGVVGNKTHKIDCLPSTVPDELIRHFMRGYIDGDGSFGKYLHNDGYYKSSLSIIGTNDFLIDFSKKAKDLSGIVFLDKLTDRYPSRETNTRALKLSGNKNVLDFLNWLYEDAAFYMERKYKKYKDMIV